MLGVDISGARADDAGRILADRLIEIMRVLEISSGLRAVGYERGDIPKLVEGTLPQHRVTKLSPRPANADDLAAMFEESL